MPGATSLASWIGASRLTVISSVALLPGRSPIGPAQPAPALQMSTSIRPVSASAALISWSGPSSSARSAGSARAPVRAATACSRASSRPLRISRAPARASATAVAAPMPDDAPVMSATAPTSRMAHRIPAPWERIFYACSRTKPAPMMELTSSPPPGHSIRGHQRGRRRHAPRPAPLTGAKGHPQRGAWPARGTRLWRHPSWPSSERCHASTAARRRPGLRRR